MTVRERARRASLAPYIRARTRAWPVASRLFVVGDRVGWSIDDDAARLAATARRLGYDVAPPEWVHAARRQAVFHGEHFAALQPRWLRSSHRLGLAYFHGRPGTQGYPEFDRAYEALRRHVERISRVQVTHGEMRELVASAGVPDERIFTIPIGVDLARFPAGDAGSRAAAREAFALPASAFVAGSFQKDGVGWDEGDEPKLIKGPDVLVEALASLHARLPELVVLLTGPARGYVRRNLERRGVPYRHRLLPSLEALATAYHALDAYVVPSRQEGGPKAVLEAMATGVPLVTTRVGQAAEIAVDSDNALVVDVDDVDGLAAALERIAVEQELAAQLRARGLETAGRYALERLDPLWDELLAGFVSRKRPHEG